MTPEEIQKTIEGMLAVQRGIQESQLELQASQLELKDTQRSLQDSYIELKEAQQHTDHQLNVIGEYLRDVIQSQAEQGRRIDQLLGYSLSAESDRLTLQERLILLENRVRKLENG
jgi:chromosome segregation ATPase